MIAIIFILFNTIVYQSHAENQPIPNWIKNTALWYGQGNIDDSEFFNLIQFLLDNKIIEISDNQDNSNNNNKFENIIIDKNKEIEQLKKEQKLIKEETTQTLNSNGYLVIEKNELECRDYFEDTIHLMNKFLFLQVLFDQDSNQPVKNTKFIELIKQYKNDFKLLHCEDYRYLLSLDSFQYYIEELRFKGVSIDKKFNDQNKIYRYENENTRNPNDNTIMKLFESMT